MRLVCLGLILGSLALPAVGGDGNESLGNRAPRATTGRRKHLNVTIQLTDTATGVVKFYTNPLNTAFQPIQDTAAFATCP